MVLNQFPSAASHVSHMLSFFFGAENSNQQQFLSTIPKGSSAAWASGHLTASGRTRCEGKQQTEWVMHMHIYGVGVNRPVSQELVAPPCRPWLFHLQSLSGRSCVYLFLFSNMSGTCFLIFISQCGTIQSMV